MQKKLKGSFDKLQNENKLLKEKSINYENYNYKELYTNIQEKYNELKNK